MKRKLGKIKLEIIPMFKPNFKYLTQEYLLLRSITITVLTTTRGTKYAIAMCTTDLLRINAKATQII